MYIKNTPKKNIRNLLNELYLIPNYQRPYTWNEEQCDKLWEDIIDAFEDNPNSEYFLGTAVLIEHDSSPIIWEVVDGQQRLTTLLLLIRALLDHDMSNRGLFEILTVHNKRTREPEESIVRLKSEVIQEDFTLLQQVLTDPLKVEKRNKKAKLYKNHQSLSQKITSWNQNNPNQLNPLVDFLLEHVQILCIECTDQESALIIFQTLNNRGLALNDTDILKAKLYGYFKTQEEKDKFIADWNNIEDKEILFRIYMHILRAKNEDFKNIPQLRKYFEDAIMKKNHSKVFEDIKKIYLFRCFLEAELDFWWYNTISLFPIDLIAYPYHTFMFRYATIKDSEVILHEKDKKLLIQVIQDMLKFVYRRILITSNVNAIKEDIFKACSLIYQKKLTNLFPEFEESEKESFETSLKSLSAGDKYTKSTLALYHVLNEKQYKEHPSIYLDSCHVEHILPKSFHNYNNWSEEDHSTYANSLGNLILFEKKVHVKADNDFLLNKQELYKNSEISDVLEIAQQKKWTPKEVELRLNKIHKRLSDFIFS